MKAIVQRRYGDSGQLELAEIARPTPGESEVLVEVSRAALNRGDWHLMTGKPYLIRVSGFGLLRPRYPVIGQEFSGTVVAMGEGVQDFSVGDRVFGHARAGAFAQWVSVSTRLVSAVPGSVSDEQAAAVPSSGLTALQGLRDIGRIRDGARVLIVGASGGVGTFAVQLARYFGGEVTGVCSGSNVEFVRSLGADRVIDYVREDYRDSPEHYDLILDMVGDCPLRDLQNLLAPEGIYVACAGDGGNFLGPIPRLIRLSALSKKNGKQLRAFVMKPNREDLEFLAERLADGTIRSCVSEVAPLSQVPELMQKMGTKRTRGKRGVALDS